MAQLERFEERPERKVIVMLDRVVLVVVAMGAVHGQAQERLAGVLNVVFHPQVTVPSKPVAYQEPGRHHVFVVARNQFIGGEHLSLTIWS